jgi:hypothetical protein
MEEKKPGPLDGVPGGLTDRKGKYPLYDRREAQGYDVSALEEDAPTQIIASSPPGDPAPETGMQPWETMNTHKQLDDYIERSGQPIPEVWDSLTIAKKKEYLSNAPRS